MSPSTNVLADQSSPSLRRDLPALAERVLIIGLDGATFDVLNPMMDSGRMPNLKAFIERGTSGLLESTRPPITPAAWTTFMTGKTPGTHGIIDFERYDARHHRLSFNSTRSIEHVRTIWQVLGDKGLKVGAINIPMTYPPRPVNGFLVTGFETPGVQADFTYPKELRVEILRRWPDYTFKTTWKRRTFGGDALFAQNLRAICESFSTGAQLTRYCGDAYGWDVLMVVYKLVDNLQHKTWRYLDPRFNRRSPERFKMAADCFARLDDALGDLFDYARSRRATVLIMSDHGHGSLEGKAQPNLLLRDWGYLGIKSRWAQTRTRARYLLDRAIRRKKGRFAHQDGVEHDLAVDDSRTRACVMHAGIYGFLYLNLKGRQPAGIVDQADYEPLRDELRRRFLDARVAGPNGKTINPFVEVYKPEELYGCKRSEREWLPDLLLVPAEGLAVIRKIRGSNAVRWLRRRKIEGTHRLNGVVAAAGNGIARGKKTHAGIIDIMPTVLAMLGLRLPDDLEGHLIADLFDAPLQIETEAASVTSTRGDESEVYSEKEQKLLTERLADLGYLE